MHIYTSSPPTHLPYLSQTHTHILHFIPKMVHFCTLEAPVVVEVQQMWFELTVRQGVVKEPLLSHPIRVVLGTRRHKLKVKEVSRLEHGEALTMGASLSIRSLGVTRLSKLVIPASPLLIWKDLWMCLENWVTNSLSHNDCLVPYYPPIKFTVLYWYTSCSETVYKHTRNEVISV